LLSSDKVTDVKMAKEQEPRESQAK